MELASYFGAAVSITQAKMWTGTEPGRAGLCQAESEACRWWWAGQHSSAVRTVLVL